MKLKQKVLVLAMNVGDNAPGIVNERLILGLSQCFDIDVITLSNVTKLDFSEVKSIRVIPYIALPKFLIYILSKLKVIYFDQYCDFRPKIRKLLIGLFGITPLDIIWSGRVKKKIIKRDYDLVLSLISFHHYAPIIAGDSISKLLKIKWAIYSVDAIPPSKEWESNELYIKGCNRMVAKYFSNSDAFFASNQVMLNYQKTLFRPKNKCILDVILTPSLNTLLSFPIPKSHIFLYTGGIYGVRKVCYLFKAFKLLLQEYPEARLHFVGSKIPESEFELFTSKERKAITIFPRTSNLMPYYRQASCLIDVDADIENDVFLSSKITNYITVNRPIICETGVNSPSRELFGNIPSIIHCKHDSEELFIAMKSVINYPITSFQDRDNVVKMFSIDSVISKLISDLSKLSLII